MKERQNQSILLLLLTKSRVRPTTSAYPELADVSVFFFPNVIKHNAGVNGDYDHKIRTLWINPWVDGPRSTLVHEKDAHLKSLSVIPQMIERSVFIDEIPNTKEHEKYDSYRYYVCGLKIDGADYTAKVVVGVKDGNKYYDHRLTEIEKGTLIDNLNGLSNSVAENQNAFVSVGKDSKLLSFLQTNSSKVVDENGEPMVVYHGSGARGIHEFRTSGRGDVENRGVYFTPQKGFAKKYGRNIYEMFLNMKNPLSVDFGGLPWTQISINKVCDVTGLTVKELEETIKPMTDWSLMDYIVSRWRSKARMLCPSRWLQDGKEV